MPFVIKKSIYLKGLCSLPFTQSSLSLDAHKTKNDVNVMTKWMIINTSSLMIPGYSNRIAPGEQYPQDFILDAGRKYKREAGFLLLTMIAFCMLQSSIVSYYMFVIFCKYNSKDVWVG